MADAEAASGGAAQGLVAGGRDPAARLRAAGLAPTRPRQRVLEALNGRAMAVSAADVHGALSAAGVRIGLTTVYRILHVLAENGLVHALPGDEQRFRMCADGPHTHLVCTSCGSVREEPTDAARRWLHPRGDFVVDIEHTPVYGVCGPCRRSGAAATGGQSYRK